MNTIKKSAVNQSVFVVMQRNMNSDGWSSGCTLITVCKTLRGANEKCEQLESNIRARLDGQKQFYFIETKLEE